MTETEKPISEKIKIWSESLDRKEELQRERYRLIAEYAGQFLNGWLSSAHEEKVLGVNKMVEAAQGLADEVLKHHPLNSEHKKEGVG